MTDQIEENWLQLPNNGPSLAYTLFTPQNESNSSPTQTKLALIAHPLGRLGGSQHDHVVQSLARSFVSQGWIVCTYDARGAGNSSGSASFSGKPEVEDFQHVLESVLLPMLPQRPSHLEAPPVHELLLCGYSFGSLAASSCPPSKLDNIRTRYLLISYPLSVMWALTVFRSSSFEDSLASLAKPTPLPNSSLGTSVLAIFGDSDQFTGVDNYRQWKAKLEATQEGELAGPASAIPFRAIEVGGADHFWRTGGAIRQLLEETKKFLEAS
ncbi:hypothetical protein T439DRAFT_355518 [Meredithblackwellia eburnea MCA 4105]